MVEILIEKLKEFHQNYEDVYNLYVKGYLDSENHKNCTLQDKIFERDCSAVVKSLKKLRTSMGYIMSYKHNVYKFREEDLFQKDVTDRLLESCLEVLSSIDFDKVGVVVRDCVKRLNICVSLHTRLDECSHNYRYSTEHREYIRYNILLNYTRLATIFYPISMLVNLEDNIKSKPPVEMATTICNFLSDLTWLELLRTITSESADLTDDYLQYLYRVEGKFDDICSIIKDGALVTLNPSTRYLHKVRISQFNLIKLLCDTYSY